MVAVRWLYAHARLRVADCLVPSGPSHAFAQDSAFHQQAFSEVRDFFDNPNANREHASNHFLVMQGNLYVTQVRARNSS